MIFGIVKRYFNLKIYSVEDVGVFVKSGKITPAQYIEITGQSYEVI